MPMKFKQIQAFITVAREGNIDAPRDKCGHSGAINHGHTCCHM